MRCEWARKDLDVAYHDAEWGVPVYDDQVLFETLNLEGAQAGLSWSTILARREGYRNAFANFEIGKVAAFTEEDCQRCLADPGIIRNRLKVYGVVKNAHAFIEVQAQHGSFANYLWAFVDGMPIQNEWTSLSQVPASTELSDLVSKDLKKKGFTFVGSTICYAYLQAVGLVNDHLTTCFRYEPVRELAKSRHS